MKYGNKTKYICDECLHTTYWQNVKGQPAASERPCTKCNGTMRPLIDTLVIHAGRIICSDCYNWTNKYVIVGGRKLCTSCG